MASPQTEDGYTKIANELIEAFAFTGIGPDEWKIVMVIFRKTYGWGKKKDCISLSQFAVATRMKKTHVCRAIGKLIKRNIITRSGNELESPITRSGNAHGLEYAIQKDFEAWKPLPVVVKPAKSLPLLVTTVTTSGHESLPLLGTTKETTKERKEKEAPSKKPRAKIPEITGEWLSELANKFPRVNIENEMDLAKDWIADHPGRIFNRSFFRGWVTRTNERLPKETEDFGPNGYRPEFTL